MNDARKLKPIPEFTTEEHYVETRRVLNELVEANALVKMGRVKFYSPDLCIAFKQTSTGDVWLLTAPDQASRGSFKKIPKNHD